MTMRHQLIVSILACVLADTATAATQQRAGAPAPAPAAETSTSRPPTATPEVNIEIDVLIHSQGPNSTPVSKSLTTVVTNGGSNSFRLQLGDGSGPRVNGDFKALIRDGRIDIGASLDVNIVEENSPAVRYRGSFSRVLVENGKSIVVSKLPDPITNRTVTVTIKATILK